MKKKILSSVFIACLFFISLGSLNANCCPGVTPGNGKACKQLLAIQLDVGCSQGNCPEGKSAATCSPCGSGMSICIPVTL